MGLARVLTAPAAGIDQIAEPKVEDRRESDFVAAVVLLSNRWANVAHLRKPTLTGVRVGFRIDNKGGTILFDGFELLRNPGADEQLSKEECHAAATLHGWAISVVSSSDRPKGYHYSPEDISRPAFFYNAYAGKAFSSTAYGGDYLAVCKGGTAFPSPPPQ
eukprot:scaffold41750_cov63-Phaeocystis_antarctica.AAC.1